MKAFLVGNFAVHMTENQWVIIEFRQSLPKMNLDNTKEEITIRDYIIMNAEQTKSLMEVLKNIISQFEKKYGKIKSSSEINIINPKKKEKENYIG